jgi:hypothetical protein
MNIRSGLISFLIVGFSFSISAQDSHTYTVIGVKGTVTSKKSGKDLQSGDAYSGGEDEEITFKEEGDMAGLVRDDGKRFVLLNRKEKKGYKCSLEKAIMIGKTRVEWKNFSIKTLEELQQHLSEAPFFFLDSVAKFKIDRKTFPQNPRQFFYFNFLWKNPKGKAERIDKKLQFRADTLIIRQSNIFKVDNSPVDPKDISDFKINYMNTSDPVAIGDFKVIFPDAEKIRNEIGILVRQQQKAGFEAKVIQGEVEAYIRQFYGAIDRVNLINYLKNNFGVVDKK